MEVFPEFPQRLYVHLPPEKLALAANARLRFVVAAEQFMGKIKVNGMELEPPIGGWSAKIGLDLDWLTTNTDIRFESKGSGYTIWCVSIELLSYTQDGTKFTSQVSRW